MTPSELRLWIDSLGISDTEAARRIGCHRNALANWLTGRSTIPRYIALAVAALGQERAKARLIATLQEMLATLKSS